MGCQQWKLQKPHAHTYNEGCDFEDREFPNNYCRVSNFDAAKYGPWCYTTDKKVDGSPATSDLAPAQEASTARTARRNATAEATPSAHPPATAPLAASTAGPARTARLESMLPHPSARCPAT